MHLEDHIDVEETGQVETYIVGRVEIVNTGNVSVLRPLEKWTLTLVTSYAVLLHR